MTLRGALLATAMMALPLAATAQPVTGVYIGGDVGLNFLQSDHLRVSQGATARAGNIGGNVGPAVVLSLGYGFGNGFRAEIEGDYRYNAISGGCGQLGSCGGNEQKAGAMVNVLYDFVGIAPMVQPYLGAGVGYQVAIEHSLHGGFGPASFSTINGDRGSFAYQAIAGVAFPIVQAPGLSLTAEYRFMGLAGDRTYGTNFSIGGSGLTRSNSDFNHSIMVGFRYEFGAAPMAAPAPMPVADMGAKTFLVFFDWNKSDLTARSEGIVRDAATYSTKSSYTRIDVDGNTDTSGTPTYNQGLSERRARVVAAELVRDGVPQQNISMHAYGETKLLVPTGPNVREPQNRRVEIVFH
jgi:OOP family OmpA-OmpF porin